MELKVLVLSGLDPSSSSGFILDHKVFSKLGVKSIGYPTLETIQTPDKLFKVSPKRGREIQEAVEKLIKEMGKPDGVKVGALGSEEVVLTLFRLIKELNLKNVVLDTPILSKSKGRLLSERGVRALRKFLIPLAEFLTPNLLEVKILSGRRDPFLGVKHLHSLGTKFLVLKGGHFKSPYATDYLYDGRKFYRFKARRVDKVMRGTGCVFSSSLLAFYLKEGEPLKALKLAKEFTLSVIEASKPSGKYYVPDL